MLELRGLAKHYGNFPAVQEIDLEIPDGEFFCLLGPSGCGKTTTLRMIAGFELPDKGQILLDGVDLSSTPAHLRHINTVFQNYALFPHLSVFDNIAFGLRMHKVDPAEIGDRVDTILNTVALAGYGNRFPNSLSGGQQQRVSLARALVNKPKILLLDEPLAALDEKLRAQMQVELANLQREIGITFIFITHNQEEALTMADRIAVMEAGSIMQVGTPDDIYIKPKSRFVANFIGQMNFIEPGDIDVQDKLRIISMTRTESFEYISSEPVGSEKLSFGIRPEQLRLSRTQGDKSENCFRACILNEVYYGDLSIFIVQLENDQVLSVSHQNYLPSGINPESFLEGENVYVCWDKKAGQLLAE